MRYIPINQIIINMTKQLKEYTGSRVTYLRISEYYRQFLVSRYGNVSPKSDQPTIVFPVSSPYYDIICRYLVNNVRMKPMSNNAFSDNAFHYRMLDLFSENDISIPPASEKGEFFAVAIPDRVCHSGRVIDTSNYWQLSSCGLVEFNRTVKREFWRVCLAFIDDCFTQAKIEDRRMTRENAISDFMMTFDIPMELYENLYRYEKRFRKEMVRDIEARRQKMEKLNDVQMIYT